MKFTGKYFGLFILIAGIYRYPLPTAPPDEDILFHDLPKKEQHWRRQIIPKDLSAKDRNAMIQREINRIFITGVWFFNNGERVYLPPSLYFFFNYWSMKDGKFAKFRYSQYHEMLFEEVSEMIPNCIGTFGFKKRRDGRTTRRMCRKVWKAIQPKYANSWLGLQSKTGKDAADVCWETLMTGYRSLPSWLKPEQAGSSDPKKKLELAKPAIRMSRTNVRRVLDEVDTGLNTTIDFRDTVEDAYDGQECLEITLDEAAKWKKARVVKAFTTYTKCVWKDGVKVGHIHAFSSPAERMGKEHDASITLWTMGDPERSIEYIDYPDGSWDLVVKKRSWFILRIFTGALEGYGGACDVYGVCDQDLAREMIQEEIANAEPEMRDELARQLPFSIDDIITNVANAIYANAEAMQKRMQLLKGMDFKADDELRRDEPKYIFGNLEWRQGIEWGEVYFKPSKNQKEFSITGRFAFQELPPEEMTNCLIKKKRLQNDIWEVDDDSENLIGIDPYDYRRTEGSVVSQGAMVGGKGLDFFEKGDKNKLWFAYLFRPPSPSVFYMDGIKACFFLSCRAQVESKNKNIIDFFEDNNCMELLMPKSVNQPKKSQHKGNATSTSLIDEICTLLDEYYGDDENIDNLYLDFLLEDNLALNPLDTLKSHLTMAMGQMLLGFMKMRLSARKKRKKASDDMNKRIGRSIANIYNF